MKSRKLLSVLLALMLVLSLAACASGDTGKTGEGGGAASTGGAASSGGTGNTTSPATTLDQPKQEVVESASKDVNVVVGLQVDPASFAPFAQSNTGRATMMFELFEQLFSYSEFGGEFLPWVAEGYEWEDMTLHITIRDNVYDQAGNHFTANDIAFMYKLYGDLGNKAALKYIDDIKVVDDTHVDFLMNTQNVTVMYSTFNSVPCFTKAAYEASPDGFATTPVYTSQYKLADYVGGSYYVLEKDENWWGNALPESERHPYTAGNASTVRYNIITDNSQMAIALETGVIDLANSVSASEIGNFLGGDYTTATLVTNPSYYLSFNASENSPCSDARIRQALAWSIDNQEVVDITLEGAGEVAYTVGGNMYANVTDELKAAGAADLYGTDIEKAKALLAEAGYPDGIELHIMVNSDATMGKAVQTIQLQAARAGITLKIDQWDSALFDTYRSDPTAGWDVMMTVRGNSSGYVQAVWNGLFTLGSTPSGNAVFLKDDYAAKAAADCEVLLTLEGNTPENVMAFYRQYFLEDCYFYGLYCTQNYYAAQPGINNIRISNVSNVLPSACSFTEDYKSVAD